MTEKRYPRLVRVRDQGLPVWGIVQGGDVYRLKGEPYAGWQPGQYLGSLANLPLLPPATPSKIVCVGRNYVAHAAEHGVAVPEEPLLFLKPPSSLIGQGDAIVTPPQSTRVEHEAELAVVIGKRCRNISADVAWSYVLGVTCGNDVTARDLQRKDGQWTRGKGFDTFCPLGPWLVTGLPEAAIGDVAVTCRVNGEVRQHGTTGQMVFPPAMLIAYASTVMTLEPGDVFLTGTPAGVGPLTPGDVVEVDIEGIGVLRNPVT